MIVSIAAIPGMVVSNAFMPMISSRLMVAPSSQQPRPAEMNEAKSRQPGRITLVRSSANPARKTGASAISHVQMSRAGKIPIRVAAMVPAARPQSNAMPPTRGVIPR